MTAKIGRPKLTNPRDKRLEVRLTKEELDKIDKAAKLINKSRTNTILYGVDLIVKETKKE